MVTRRVRRTGLPTATSSSCGFLFPGEIGLQLLLGFERRDIVGGLEQVVERIPLEIVLQQPLAADEADARRLQGERLGVGQAQAA